MEVGQWAVIAFLIGCVCYSYKDNKLWIIKFVTLIITIEYTFPFYKRTPSLPSWLYDCGECLEELEDGTRLINPIQNFLTFYFTLGLIISFFHLINIFEDWSIVIFPSLAI